ncbi:glycosyltransferase [Romeria aff. gracilis LEGE 07310]|uniref:Glycosyltransferase n=1 Tax=Vasconcelosia minhoensis LEGE 07310 TaxID=915328 RepID=A0A8J7DPM4_9CYAN|nr:glycosyltransferase [Romeria gracilis]MBE9079940.1 glycosyltransferase [Romeria aff. gracilis LEGE 07310]
MKRLAIVIPWFGEDLKGGAEQQAWQVATRLAQRGHNVEVLTTRCQSFLENWSKNHYRGGLTRVKGLKVRRFRVNQRDEDAFGQVNLKMLSLPSESLRAGVNPVSSVEASVFVFENISSRRLLRYLQKHYQRYHAFLFIPYLYGPILNGLPLVAERAFLQPCLHDEVYAYLPQVEHIFHAAQGLLFISEGEALLAQQLYGPGIIAKSQVVGAAVEAGQHYDTSVTQVQGFDLQQRYILCLGRRDPLKNTDLLVRAYARYQQSYPDSNLRLVLAGPGSRSYSGEVPGLIDFGLVEESEKESLLANCLALFQPSRNESYSRVIMEAWYHGKPVAAHRQCLATATVVGKVQGGWLATSLAEWAELLAKVDQQAPDKLTQLGTLGKTYVTDNASWDKVIQRYELALGLTPSDSVQPSRPKSPQLKEIHQVLPNLAYGDAISNHAIAIRDYLRQQGYYSDIFVRFLDPQVAHQAKTFQARLLSPDASVLYHHSIGSELTAYVIAHPGPKCLIYHNITPAEFFRPYRLDIAQQLEKGQTELKQLAPHFLYSVGDSTYNAEELAAVGFAQPEVLPISVEPSKWDFPADSDLMEQLQDGKVNLLFVGRLAPNKRQDHLIEAFAHYLKLDDQARLILVGGVDLSDPYYSYIKALIKRLNLSHQILLTGQVNDAQLAAYYRTAHLFWSMSEHEGFCVPLVEAMWFDIPILAYKSTAVPETLGQAGLMFNSKDTLIEVAALAKLLVRDEEPRRTILNAQRQRREYFLPGKVQKKLDALLHRMGTRVQQPCG